MPMLSALRRINAKRLASVVLDLIVAAFSILAAYLVAYGPVSLPYVPGVALRTATFVVASAFALIVFRVHRGSWRFVSIHELLGVIKAVVTAVVIDTAFAFLVSRAEYVPRSVPILTAIFMITGLCATRLTYRLIMDGSLNPFAGPRPFGSKTSNVILLGLSNSGENLIRATRRGNASGMRVVAVFDEDRQARGRFVHGVKVHGGLHMLPTAMANLTSRNITVEELVIAEATPDRARLNEILDVANGLGLRVSRLPSLTATELLTGTTLIKPKPIQLEDLLGRPEVKPDLEGIGHLIEGRVVMATGAGGSIGSELCRQIATFAPRLLIIADSSEFQLYTLDRELRESFPDLPIVTRIADIRDARRMSGIMDHHRPAVVFHAAALKHVPMVEDNPLEAIKTNVLGTKIVADAAIAAEVETMVMISTDKAVNPTNVMGATKRAAESYCQSLDVVSERTRFKTVRFGNVLGSNGSVVPLFQRQIEAGGPVTVTHRDVVRFFMTIPEAVRLVLHASAFRSEEAGTRGRIMVLDMGKPVRIVDLAERMIRLAGLKPNIDIMVEITGLRPGEKLYEELFDPNELEEAETGEGFVVASPRIIDRSFLLRAFDQLETAVQRGDTARAMALLSHIVPEYRPLDAGKTAPVAQSGTPVPDVSTGPALLPEAR